MRYTTELVLRRIDEFHCDCCGGLVACGRQATYDLATGAGYCSPLCARQAGCESRELAQLPGLRMTGPACDARVEFYPPRPAAAGKGVAGV